jgi:hypothetical protein
LLVLVREFDERAGWLQWGLSNCAEWLHWRCDLSMSAAREKVRVAHANRSLRVFRDAERETMTITVELPLETGELLEKALDRARYERGASPFWGPSPRHFGLADTGMCG